MIFHIKNDSLSLFGNTMNDLQNKIEDFHLHCMEAGESFSNISKKIGTSLSSWWNGNRHGYIEDIDSYMPKLDQASANAQIKYLIDIEAKVKKGQLTWQKYYDSQDSEKKYIAKWGESTQGQIRTAEDLIKVTNDERAAILQKNKAIELSGMKGKLASVGLKAFAAAGNMAAYALISKGIELAAAAIDNYIHRTERAKEKLEETRSTFSASISEIETLNSELEENSKKIDELQSKGTLSYVEQSELIKLQNITQELERQLDIKNMQTESDAENLAKDNKRAFELEFGSVSFDFQEVQNKLDSIASDTPATTNLFTLEQEGLEGLAAAYLAARQTKEDFEKDGSDESAEVFKDFTDYYNDQLVEKLAALQSYKENLQSIMDFRELTEDEAAFYQQLEQGTKIIYSVLDSGKWNSWALKDIFDTDGIEKTKEELIQMAQAGTLDETAIADFENLMDAVNGSELILQNGQTALQSFLNKINALAGKGNTIEKIDENFDGLSEFSLSETDLSMLCEYQSAMNKIHSSLQNLHDLSTDDIFSLITAFPEYAHVFREFGVTGVEGSGDLEGALQKLAMILYENAQKACPQMSDALRAMLDDTSDGMKKLQSLEADIEELDAFISRISSGQSLNESEVSRLINKYSDLSDAVIVTAEGYQFETEALESLLDTRLTESNTSIACQIEQTENTIEQITRRIEAYQLEIDAVDKLAQAYSGFSYHTAEDYLSANSYIEDLLVNETIGDSFTINGKNYTFGGLYANIAPLSAQLSQYTSYLEKLKSKITGIAEQYSGSSSGTDTSSSTAVFDWIETRIQRTGEAIDQLNARLDTVSDHTAQNAYIDEMLSSYDSKLDMLTEARKQYLQQAEAVGLSDAYIDKIRTGTLLIEDNIKDITIKDKIEEYQKWYGKALDVEASVTDTTQKIKELNRQKLDNLINDYERVTSLAEAYRDYHQALLDVKEAKGSSVPEADYYILIQKELDIQATLQEQYQKVQAEFSKLDLTPADDAWYDYQKELLSIQSRIEDCTVSVEGFKDAILSIRWQQFETGIHSLEQLDSELKDVSSLLGDGALFKDGEITDLGMTKLGLYAQQYVNAKQQAAEYENAMHKLSMMYKNGSYSLNEYNEKLAEFQNAQRAAALSANDARKAIMQFAKDAVQGQIDSIKELTEAKKEALDAEQELYEYQKSITDRQKSIQALEKRIAALSLSDAREDRALKLQLEEELAKQMETLADEQRQHSIDSQKELLDSQYEAYEKEKKEELEELESNLDKQNELIEQYLSTVTEHYHIVYDNIQSISEEFGITFSESLTSPWENAASAAKLYAQAAGDILAQLQINADALPDFNGTSTGTQITDRTGQWKQDTNPDSANYGRWWYEHSDGSYTTADWEKIDGKWYCFDSSGWMGENEWVRGKDGEWYYLGSDGAMAADGWKNINDKWYCFDQDGRLYLYGYTPDGYYVDGDGIWDGMPQITDMEILRSKAASFRHYANGTKQIPFDQLAHVDESGEELLLRTDENGRLDYLTKGTGIIPADLTARLIDFAYNPGMLCSELPPAVQRSNLQPVSLHITSPLMVVNGGLDSSIMHEVDKKINQIPAEIKSQFKNMGIK